MKKLVKRVIGKNICPYDYCLKYVCLKQQLIEYKMTILREFRRKPRERLSRNKLGEGILQIDSVLLSGKRLPLKQNIFEIIQPAASKRFLIVEIQLLLWLAIIEIAIQCMGADDRLFTT